MGESASRRFVVAYDVPDDRRRAKLARVLDGYGDRVQFSLFEAKLDLELFDIMIAEVREVLELETDRFRVYGLCASCAGGVFRLGPDSEDELPGEERTFVV